MSTVVSHCRRANELWLELKLIRETLPLTDGLLGCDCLLATRPAACSPATCPVTSWWHRVIDSTFHYTPTDQTKPGHSLNKEEREKSESGAAARWCGQADRQACRRGGARQCGVRSRRTGRRAGGKEAGSVEWEPGGQAGVQAGRRPAVWSEWQADRRTDRRGGGADCGCTHTHHRPPDGLADARAASLPGADLWGVEEYSGWSTEA